MYLFKRTSGILLPKKFDSFDFFKKIIEHLIRKNKDYQTGEIRENKFYAETDDFIVIPRYFPIEKFLDSSKFRINDNSSSGKRIEIETNMKLLPGQENVVDFMMKNNNGIIQLHPGFGKTNISIYIICKQKLKTFVLVHKDALLKQWVERFLGFSNIKKENIGVLSSVNFKEDLKKDIIISTVQMFLSLLRKEKRQEFLKELSSSEIGIFIGDEVHTSVGAPLFSLCSLFVNSKKTYGLSATPYRYDNNEDIIKFHLGEIFSPKLPNINLEHRTKVVSILFDFGIMKKSRRYVSFNGKFERSRYLNLLKNSKILINFCLRLIQKCVFENRETVLISERIKFIDSIYNGLFSRNIKNISKFISGETLEALSAEIILSTPGKIRDGVDIPKKSALILTSPISNIEQAIGRITRNFPNKPDPIVFDFIDIGCKDISATFYKRFSYYSDKKFEMQYFFLNEYGDLKKLEKSRFFEILKLG